MIIQSVHSLRVSDFYKPIVHFIMTYVNIKKENLIL